VWHLLTPHPAGDRPKKVSRTLEGTNTEELRRIAAQIEEIAWSLIVPQGQFLPKKELDVAMDTLGVLTQEACNRGEFDGVDYLVFRDFIFGRAMRDGKPVDRGTGWRLAIQWLCDHARKMQPPHGSNRFRGQLSELDMARLSEKSGSSLAQQQMDLARNVRSNASALAEQVKDWCDVDSVREHPPASDQHMPACSEEDESPQAGERFIFAREGKDVCYIEAFGESEWFKILRGFEHIEQLIRTPGKPIPVLKIFSGSSDYGRRTFGYHSPRHRIPRRIPVVPCPVAKRVVLP
jgi:hypothetical protein